jgi:hypothetical protein
MAEAGLLDIERFVLETNEKADEREVNDVLSAVRRLTVRAQVSGSCVDRLVHDRQVRCSNHGTFAQAAITDLAAENSEEPASWSKLHEAAAAGEAAEMLSMLKGLNRPEHAVREPSDCGPRDVRKLHHLGAG